MLYSQLVQNKTSAYPKVSHDTTSIERQQKRACAETNAVSIGYAQGGEV